MGQRTHVLKLARWSAAMLCAAMSTSTALGANDMDSMQRQRRLDAVHVALNDLMTDPPQCLAVIDTARGDMQADWSPASLEIWRREARCAQLQQVGEAAAPVEVLTRIWQPAIAHFSNPPPGDDDAAGLLADVLRSYWVSLQTSGHVQQADAMELQHVDRWFQEAASPETAGRGRAVLLRLARSYYGARDQTARMTQLHALYAQRLGASHPATLALLKARIFNHRQWSRPAAALALSDEYATLVARDHADNVRLAMDNRSERVGALAGVGRYADALEEGRTWLQWAQAQRPTPHGAIMRSAYNLAGLCIELADLDGAVQYAQLAIDAGQQALSFADRHETVFSAVLRDQARLLRGDPGAAEDLRAGLEAMKDYDLASTAPLFDLARWAREHGDRVMAEWATHRFASVVSASTIPLQPERALPLYLDVVEGAAGTPDMLAKASEVLAHGLVGRDLPLDTLAHFALARHVEPHQADGAVWLYKRGARTLQRLRGELPQAAESVQRLWLSAYEADLRRFIGVLIDSGRLTEAEQAMEVLRDEELVEFRRRSRGAARGPRDGRTSLSFTPQELALDLALQPSEARMRRAAAEADARTAAKPDWRDWTQQRDAAADAALAETAQALRSLAMQPGSGLPGGQADLLPSSPLPRGVGRVTYFLRGNSLSAVLHVGSTRHALQLSVTPTALSRTVQALRAELSHPGAQVPAAAQQLHRWLVAPLGRHLGQVQHLQVVPDGVLRYVPFAALHDGQRYLVERFSVSIASAATANQPTASSRQRVAHPPRVAAFGRSLPDSQHAALPGVERELAVLGGLRGARVQPALNERFTRESLHQALQTRPDVVHLATHFVLDPAGEEASYLLLGDGTRLPLSQLRQLPWSGVELALLSACDSALAVGGGTAAQGRELTGLAAALQSAGVSNVMATLWRIDDASTARWMQAFYAPWQQRGAAAAMSAGHLARTQRAWLARHRGTELAHPYHWGAFAWMGSGG